MRSLKVAPIILTLAAGVALCAPSYTHAQATEQRGGDPAANQSAAEAVRSQGHRHPPARSPDRPVLYVARGSVTVNGVRLGAGHGVKPAPGLIDVADGQNAEVRLFDLPQ
jgi:hypothetical protein